MYGYIPVCTSGLNTCCNCTCLGVREHGMYTCMATHVHHKDDNISGVPKVNMRYMYKCTLLSIIQQSCTTSCCYLERQFLIEAVTTCTLQGFESSRQREEVTETFVREKQTDHKQVKFISIVWPVVHFLVDL